MFNCNWVMGVNMVENYKLIVLILKIIRGFF